MTRIRIRHYVVKPHGMGFWQPTKKMRRLGFYSVPCGPDGPDAWRRAEEWNRRWDLTRRGGRPPRLWWSRTISRRNDPRS
jgi:hypothetical protein